MPEEWRTVPEYEGLYLASNLGEVRSLPRNTTRGRILKHIPDKRGYLYVTLTKNGRQRRYQVHQVVMLAFAGFPKPGEEVRHLDGNPANNRWAPGDTDEEIRANGGNLIYGTHARNMQDKADHGTDPNTAKTHCPQDHEYTPENTRVLASGSRACKACAKAKGREWWRTNTRKNPITTCPVCEREFERPLGQGHRKYCSNVCAKNAHAERQRLRTASI